MSKKLIQRTKDYRERGQIILMVGLATIVMFGIVGLAVDVGRLYVTRVEIGRAADAAALSGILELNGQPSGLDNAKFKAEAYFAENEPNAIGIATPDTVENELTLDAEKTIKMIFLSVLGIKTATVTAHAKAGFGTQFLDAVMVLDATQSMVGNPITEARKASKTFKDILLGSSPTGNVLVGVTAFRGCYDTSVDGSCIPGSWTQPLSYNSAGIASTIDNINGGGPNVGTNVCTGLAKGWEIISDPSNHDDDVLYPGNRQYMIILSDGDNYYPGHNTYRNPYDTSAPLDSNSSPEGAVIAGQAYPCQPYSTECGSPWSGSYCKTGTYGGSTSDNSCDQAGGSNNGYMNCHDGSNPTTCSGQNPTKRERQLDVRTLNLARAIKSQGVEIFVVAFAGPVPGCNLDSIAYFNDEVPSECNTVKDIVKGPIGDNSNEGEANHQLLKCMSSNTQGTNDHYFYANSESELNSIFTSIANQIAHRLIE